jgi:hypothetical protein
MAVGRETGARDYKLLKGALRGIRSSRRMRSRSSGAVGVLELARHAKVVDFGRRGFSSSVDLDIVFPIPLFFLGGLHFTCNQAP